MISSPPTPSTTTTDASTKRTRQRPVNRAGPFPEAAGGAVEQPGPDEPPGQRPDDPQIAQINTVTGIQQLNQTMQSMASQFNSLQVMQGTAPVGRSVC